MQFLYIQYNVDLTINHFGIYVDCIQLIFYFIQLDGTFAQLHTDNKSICSVWTLQISTE